MVWRFVAILILLGLLAGCRNPLRTFTEGRLRVHNSPVEDYGPLAEMAVVPNDDEDCGKIALIDVDGPLLNAPLTGLTSVGENPVAVFREKLDRVAVTAGYRAVVLRINSPGGGVTASDIMWRDLQGFKARTGLPVVACLMDVSTGGAYYLALAADHIAAHPTTIVGGIGVILNLYNLEDNMMQFNILGTPVKAGRHIDLGTPIEPMDDPSRVILQEIADQYHARFRDMVRHHRGTMLAHDAAWFDGRIFLAPTAQQANLVDSIGYLDDALEIARQMANLPAARVVMLRRDNDPARSPYAISPNTPIQGSILPIGIPGLERTRLPTFLYMWQPEPTYERRASGG